MINYKIDGCESSFSSKPENFERDVLRWKQRNSLKHDAQVTILENDNIPEPAIDWASLSNSIEQPAVSESTPTAKRSNKRKPAKETLDLPAVSDRVDKFDLSDADSITEWNELPNDSTPESN